MKKVIYILLSVSFLFTACSREKMADINIDPTVVETPDIKYLFTNALYNLESYAYGEWFYDNSQYILPWMQITVGNNGSANSSTMNQMGSTGSRYSIFYNIVGEPLVRIRHLIDQQAGASAASYRYIRALTYFVHIYCGLKVTDVQGAMPYKEALQAFYTDPPLLAPVFDTQQDLLATWDNELKENIRILSEPVTVDGKPITQVDLGERQDLIYGGDISKWIKLANTLRLKIAVRLYQADPQNAVRIAEEVAADGRLMSSIDDDFYWYGGEQFYNFGEGIWHGVAAKNLVDFLRKNKDPRLRFAFSKNDFNSMVVQGYLDQGVEIPDYILQDAVIVQENGKSVFKGWQGDGEPWVRYHGAPVTISGELSTEINNKYFEESKFQLTVGESKRTLRPVSFFNKSMVQPNQTITYPGVSEISDQYRPNGSYAYREVLVSAAETQFYLAEFKLLGANIPQDAATWFKNGVALSVESMDRVARDLNIPYYNEPYDKQYGKAIRLLPDEISDLLARPDYTLTGNVQEDLEKVYINLILDRLLTPTEIYVTARRSGVPATNSHLWAREPFSSYSFSIPRRFVINEPAKSDINYNNKVNAYNEKGFTMNTNVPSVLENQRIWYDKNAPDWGVR